MSNKQYTDAEIKELAKFFAKASGEILNKTGEIIDQLQAENERLREALEDIEQHTVEPFTTRQWINYANYVAKQALGRRGVMHHQKEMSDGFG